MTAILSWLNQEKGQIPYIMTIGDTKISNISNGNILTLEGAKILELMVRCTDLSNQCIYHVSPIEFSYAGSSLVGLNVYTYLQAIFSNLGGVKSGDLPDCNSICLKAKEVLQLYTRSIRDKAEVLMFGYCPKNKTPFICSIEPVMLEETINYEVRMKTVFKNQLEIVLIGDKKNEIRDLVSAKKELLSKESLEYWRAPARVLKEIIEENKFKTIGGNIQLAISNLFRFDLYSIVVPISKNEQRATLKFRNFDLFDEIGQRVGDCFVTIKGMDLFPNIKQ